MSDAPLTREFILARIDHWKGKLELSDMIDSFDRMMEAKSQARERVQYYEALLREMPEVEQ